MTDALTCAVASTVLAQGPLGSLTAAYSTLPSAVRSASGRRNKHGVSPWRGRPPIFDLDPELNAYYLTS